MTGPQGSLYYGLGAALSKVAGEHGDVRLLVVGMGGPQVIMPQFGKGGAGLTIMSAGDAYDAFRGDTSTYTQAYPAVRLVAEGASNSIGALVRRDSDIRTLQDLKGRRVAGVYSAHKICESTSTAILANAGLTWDDVTVVPVTHSKSSAEAVRDGRADATLCGAIGQATVKEVNAQEPIRFVGVDTSEAAWNRLLEHFPVAKQVTWQAGSSDGIVDDIVAAGAPIYVLADESAPDPVVHAVLTALNEHLGELQEAAGPFRRWSTETFVSETAKIPYHDAAIAYYKEKGMWPAEMDEVNSRAGAKAGASN